jgi:hypothetical protein
VNEDNFRKAREASRHFRNKKREYLKDKITDIELNSKNKNIRDLYRGITETETKTNVVEDEKGNLLVYPQKILTRWKNYLSAIECTEARWY